MAFGSNTKGQCDIPALRRGTRYVQVAANWDHSVLLRSDGHAVACGDNSHGQCDVPPPEKGLRYVWVCAGRMHTVLLCNDGSAVACGDNSFRQCAIPRPEDGLAYVQASAADHTVLLRSDGSVVAVGANQWGQCNVPALDGSLEYVQVVASPASSTLLLRSDGQVVTVGSNLFSQRRIPRLEDGLTYTQVSAGLHCTALLRSDGAAVVMGKGTGVSGTIEGSGDNTFVRLACGGVGVAALFCDGHVEELGSSSTLGLKSAPQPRQGEDAWCYVVDTPTEALRPDVLQLSLDAIGVGTYVVTCQSIAGEVLFGAEVPEAECADFLQQQLADEFGDAAQAILPDGRLLSTIDAAFPIRALFDATAAESLQDVAGDAEHGITEPHKQVFFASEEGNEARPTDEVSALADDGYST